MSTPPSKPSPSVGSFHAIQDHSLGRNLVHRHAPGLEYDHDHDDFGEEVEGEAARSAVSRVGLPALLGTFIRLGTLTFGGSIQSWVYREVVERLKWLDNRTFVSGLTVAQVLPGANPVNIAVYVGLRLRGVAGAVVAVLGMVIPSFCLILMLGYLYRTHGHLPAVQFLLVGMAAAGVGATLSMAARMARRIPRNWPAMVVAVAVFTGVVLLHWPIVPVVLVAVPLSVGSQFLLQRRGIAHEH